MSTKNRELSVRHKAAFRQRRKAGLVAVAKPWDWLSAAEVKEIALKAYALASHGLLEDMQEDRFTAQELREVFAMNLAEHLTDLVMAGAVIRGGCWPVTAETPRHANYPKIAADLCASVPADWRPQYPVFKPSQEVPA